jgi:hypothetical protein
MSAPSPEHERRVALLDAAAILAGCTQSIRLGSRLAPDVCRVSDDGRVFVGDAKATEPAGCGDTARRLRRYLRACRLRVARGELLRVAVCHGTTRGARDRWIETLHRVAADLGCTPRSSGHLVIDVDTELSWVDLGHTAPIQ